VGAGDALAGVSAAGLDDQQEPKTWNHDDDIVDGEKGEEEDGDSRSYRFC
jgi:hypothetical protein